MINNNKTKNIKKNIIKNQMKKQKVKLGEAAWIKIIKIDIHKIVFNNHN